MADLRIVHHHVDMNIAVARMPETGHRHAVLFLEPGGKRQKLLQTPARHNDILI